MNKGFSYIFITEEGTVTLPYEDYLKSGSLRDAVQDKRRAFLNLGKRVVSFDRRWLNSHPQKKRDFDLLEQEQRKNPVRFYLPCCARSGLDSSAHKFLNDQASTVTGIHAGNRFGKTLLLWIKQLVTRGVIKCDPAWEIFTDHGVRYREWDGPKTIGVGTYEWDNHISTIWPQVIQLWTPIDELGPFAQEGGRWPNFKSTPSCEMNGGSVAYLKAYSQHQSAYESQAMDGWAWDEQVSEPQFDGANMRCATKRWWYDSKDRGELLGSGWHDFALTPHKLEDRADTGAGTFIHALAEHTDTKGMTSQFYKGDMISDTPDWIYSERVKEEMMEEWITAPARIGDQKKLREGRSRLYGDWHSSSGLVYEDWQHAIHVIDLPEIPDEWTRFRAIDHGQRNPFSCLFSAVTPDNDVVIYDEYIAVGRIYSENVEAIIERAGNQRITYSSECIKGMDISIYREIMCGTRFFATVMDSRSFSTPDKYTNQNLSDAYRRAGLTMLQPASGLSDDKAIPIVSEWLRVDYDRKHIITGEYGAPRLYVTSNCKQLIQHIERYVWQTTGRAGEQLEKPKKTGFDHDLDALKYMMQIPPRYVPGFSFKKEERNDEERGIATKSSHSLRKRDSITAY